MTGLISFILMVMGGVAMVCAGMLEEEGSRSTAKLAAYIGSVLLLCAWWLA